MNVEQGDVVIGPDFIGGSERRPFVVINNDSHPFANEECIAVLVTTTEREEAVPLPEQKFKEGELPRESFASPWTITTLKTSVIRRKAGELGEDAVREISDQVQGYVESR